MSANMYDQAAEAQFMNTYVPINFGELYRIGAAQKEEMNRAADQFTTQLQKFGEFRSPSAVDTKRYYDLTINRDDFQQAINQMVSNPDYLKDAANRSQLQSLINSVDYSTLGNLKQSRDALLQRQEVDQKLMLENRYNPFWHDVDYNNYDTVGSGKVFDDLSPLPYMSVRELVEPYVNNLKGEFLGANKGFLWKGVTDEMTDDQLRQNMSSIQNTPQYDKYIEMYQKQGLTKEQAVEQLNKEIFTAGREFTWNDADRDPYAIESMRLQAKYAAQEKPNNLQNLTRVLEIDATRNHLFRFTDLTPQDIDNFAQNGFKALTPEKQEQIKNAMDPEYVKNNVKDIYYSVLDQTRRPKTAENAALDMLSSPISYEASEKYAKYGTTGKQDKDGRYTANNSNNFILAEEFITNMVGTTRLDEKSKEGLQRFIGIWNDGNTFSNFKISPDQRQISDGRNIYLVKHAYVPVEDLKAAKVEDKTLKSLGTIVTIDNGPRTTERMDNRGRVDSTTTTYDKPTKMVRMTVLQQLPRAGEAAITADAKWMNDDLSVLGKTQDSQDWQSQNENLN